MWNFNRLQDIRDRSIITALKQCKSQGHQKDRGLKIHIVRTCLKKTLNAPNNFTSQAYLETSQLSQIELFVTSTMEFFCENS